MTRRIVTFLLAWALACTTHGAAMADKELTFQTWCIGRHLIDVPESYEPLENYGTINAMRVEPLGPGDADTLNRVYAQRAEALASGQVMDEGVPLVFRGQYRDSELQVLAHELDLGQAPGASYTWTEEAYVVRDGAMLRVVQVLSEDEEAGPRAQMLDLARNVTPRTRQGVPKAVGSCLPDAIVAVAPTSEVHGMTFVPRDADGAPVGLEVSITSRSADDPALDLEEDMPRRSLSEPFALAGLEGLLVEDPERFGPSRLAVLTREASGDRPALRVQIYYYDERPEPGAEPYTQAHAQHIWDRIVSSFRERSVAQ
ncbi:MAG: hypothetical protein AAF227_11090 [Pseudomonadota bacterium]